MAWASFLEKIYMIALRLEDHPVTSRRNRRWKLGFSACL